jgi:hypothetical protein
LGYGDFAVSDCRGYAGGIVVAWNKDCIMVDVCDIKIQFIHMKVKYPKGE